MEINYPYTLFYKVQSDDKLKIRLIDDPFLQVLKIEFGNSILRPGFPSATPFHILDSDNVPDSIHCQI